ncbi:acyl carrier protein [Galbibacter pacificus]|uniref:Acyl carrier protein n=1 Tax=Galbibacter pacificus TaxID=2996052 RepID=A0ABT6FNC1_9FLAO|nr:acyl carrier protein [Galbibacter pacificus]MDG3581283.1 acyl carrier protein [Galbibacter pacificus]MDG3584761.1 acyl carrier protein [Galbibacter pacificus]
MNNLKENDIIEFVRLKIVERTDIDIDDITEESSLEEIGLGSLDVVLISGEIEDEFKVEVDPMMMFESKTLKEVASRVIASK